MKTESTEKPNDDIEAARILCIEMLSAHLASEIVLAKNGNGFFNRKYYTDYLKTKYAHQNAMNEFYNILHELSK